MKAKVKFILIICDSVSLILAFTSAYLLRNFGPFRLYLDQIQPLEVYLKVLPFALLVLILTHKYSKLYTKEIRVEFSNEVLSLFRSCFVWALIIMAVSYLTKYDYSRIIVILTFIFLIIYLIIVRAVFRNLEKLYHQKGYGATRIAIIGAGIKGRELARKLKSFERFGYTISGFIDDEAKSKKESKIIGKLENLHGLVKEREISEMYIVNPSLSHDLILNVISGCFKLDVTFVLTSNIFPLKKPHPDISNLDTLTQLRLKDNKLYDIVKRVFDLIFGSVLYFVTTPLWLVIGLLIHLDDNGKLLIKQKRVGERGKEFDVLKFRTMKETTNRYANSPRNTYDLRITRVGKILRKTSLDELPQLINIMRGEMSIVGPRPEMPQIVANYQDWQKIRLMAKPGLTGLWQILGRKNLPLQQNLEYDFYYICNRSFIFDLEIIVRTIPAVVFGRGAY